MRILGRRASLAQQFTLVFSVVILLLVGGVSALVEHFMSRTLYHQAELRTRSLALSLAAVSRPYLLNYDYLTLRRMADATQQEQDLAYVVILDKEGKPAGYGGPEDSQEALLKGVANLRAMNTEVARVQRVEWQAAGSPISVLEAMVPVRLEGDPTQRWGTVRVGLSLEPARREMLWTRFLLLLAATFGILASVYVSHRLARQVARPLARLVDAAMELERGHWNPEFEIRTGDEIEELARRFASAAQSLDRQKRELVAAKEELTTLNATLEEKVHRRTSELAASREKYRLLVEGSPDAFVLLEEDRVAFANRAFLRIFEYPPEAAVLENLRWTQVLHSDFHRVARDHFRKAEETLGEFRAEMVGQTRSGRAIELEVRGRGVRYRGGSAVELVLSDVSEKRRFLRQVVQSERLRAMGEMTAMVAHNFNNLLAVILGRTQLLLSKSENGSLSRNLEAIRASTLRAGEMVRQLQEYFGEQVDLRFGEVDVNALLLEVVSYFTAFWRGTRDGAGTEVSVTTDLAPLPPVLGAGPLLQDVFRRILINAAESMPKGGEIRVVTEPAGSVVRVRIEDAGVGMAPDVLRRAFEPFFTTKGSRARGLGLAASFGIIQRHEGRIDVHSEQDRGTRVDILLPVHTRKRLVPLHANASDEGEAPAIVAAEDERQERPGSAREA